MKNVILCLALCSPMFGCATDTDTSVEVQGLCPFTPRDCGPLPGDSICDPATSWPLVLCNDDGCVTVCVRYCSLCDNPPPPL